MNPSKNKPNSSRKLRAQMSRKILKIFLPEGITFFKKGFFADVGFTWQLDRAVGP